MCQYAVWQILNGVQMYIIIHCICISLVSHIAGTQSLAGKGSVMSGVAGGHIAI